MAHELHFYTNISRHHFSSRLPCFRLHWALIQTGWCHMGISVWHAWRADPDLWGLGQRFLQALLGVQHTEQNQSCCPACQEITMLDFVTLIVSTTLLCLACLAIFVEKSCYFYFRFLLYIPLDQFLHQFIHQIGEYFSPWPNKGVCFMFLI